MAAALIEPDLRDALARVGVPPVPDGTNEVTLITMLLSSTLGNSWPSQWRGNNEFAPYRDGFVIATIQALDVAEGRPARPLNDEQRECLATWEGRSV